MKVHTENHWNNPWILGRTSGNCGISEEYIGSFKVGYRALERAVDILCERLDSEPIDFRNADDRNTVATAIYTICVLCIEAVRFPLLKYNFATFLLVPMVPDRDMTKAERNCICSWRKMSRCAERSVQPYHAIDFVQPITEEFVTLAENDPATAHQCVKVRHIPSPGDEA